MKSICRLLLPLLLAATLHASPNISKHQLEQAIHSAADYLVNQVNEDGSFIYHRNLDPDIKMARKYNMLRHAGAIYALCMHEARFPKPEVREAIRQSIGYLRNTAIGPVPGHPGLKAVWSDTKISNTGDPLTAKLGGSGISLVALTSYETLEPGSVPLEELRALAQFIAYLQKPDGSFYSKYVPEEGGRTDKWTSLYYPGEAALGLVMLYELDPDPLWLETAAKAMNYLAMSRKGQAKVPADHWALLATARLMALDIELPVERKTLINHAIQIAGGILSGQQHAHKYPEFDGGFNSSGRTTPTATRLEGLQASLNFIPREFFAHQQIKASIPAAVQCLLNAQVTTGPHAGAIPAAIRKLQGSSDPIQKFNRQSTEVRIDYVQHTLSAWIQYWDRMNAED